MMSMSRLVRCRNPLPGPPGMATSRQISRFRLEFTSAEEKAGLTNRPNRYGRPLVQIDKAEERRVRLKIDLMTIPTVALLYLFCFIDRANIGMPDTATLPAHYDS